MKLQPYLILIYEYQRNDSNLYRLKILAINTKRESISFPYITNIYKIMYLILWYDKKDFYRLIFYSDIFMFQFYFNIHVFLIIIIFTLYIKCI
jgi:hypothetical protein